MSDQVWWYATRAAGLMTWSTACAAVIVGLLLSTRIVKNRTGPWLLDLHRFLGGISVLFLLVHMGTLYLDPFEDFGPRELLVPGASTWNTEAAAWGIIAGFTLVLVEVTSLMRRWISATVWRMFHMMSIVTAAAGTYHAWLGGSDVDNPLTWLIAGAGSVIVVLLVGVRLRRAGNEDHTTADRSSREALLREMRQRLEGLPVAEPRSVPEFDPAESTALPRRGGAVDASPFDDVPLLPGQTSIPSPIAVPDAPPAPPSVDDAFAAVPLSDESVDLGGWNGRPTGAGTGPFDRSPVNPFDPTPGPGAPADEADDITFTGHHAPDPFLRGDQSPPPLPTRGASPGGNPFDRPTESPFPPSPFAEPVSSFTSDELFAESPRSPFEDPAERFEQPAVAPAPAPLEPAPAFDPSSPFGSEVPAGAVVPVEASVPAAAVAAPTPPPLPQGAIDPVTGQPDQAAYQAWLIDWLAFAEKYGEETPEDPNRV